MVHRFYIICVRYIIMSGIMKLNTLSILNIITVGPLCKARNKNEKVLPKFNLKGFTKSTSYFGINFLNYL